VIALSVAAALAVFLLYTAVAGGGTPSVRPSQVAAHSGEVTLAGKVVGRVSGDAHAGGLRFMLRDVKGTATVPVRYTGSVPDLFKVGRDVSVTGTMQAGTFVAKHDSLVTKCPSKYTDKQT
jgi:cytochrome c-type biogenesis protein CcmE